MVWRPSPLAPSDYVYQKVKVGCEISYWSAPLKNILEKYSTEVPLIWVLTDARSSIYLRFSLRQMAARVFLSRTDDSLSRPRRMFDVVSRH